MKKLDSKKILEQLNKELAEDARKREEACIEALPGFLKGYNCTLVASVVIEGNQIKQGITPTALQEQPSEEQE